MIEKILKEINRLMGELDGYSALEALDYIESYVNTISREPASEDLKEAAQQHSKQTFNGLLIEDNIDAFKAGAEWQKQQIMKDAVETTIVNDWQYGKDPDHAIIPAIHQRIKEFTVGDKVKIIIVKED